MPGARELPRQRRGNQSRDPEDVPPPAGRKALRRPTGLLSGTRVLETIRCGPRQVSVLDLFNRILHDSETKGSKHLAELRNFIQFGVLPGACGAAARPRHASPGFLAAVQKNPFWFVEALFWKSPADLDDLLDGAAACIVKRSDDVQTARRRRRPSSGRPRVRPCSEP